MKNINVKCYANGTAKMTEDALSINLENNATRLTIDFSDLAEDYPGITKWVDILTQADENPNMRYELGTDDIVTLDLTYNDTVAGTVTVTPFMYDMDYNGKEVKVKFVNRNLLTIYNQPDTGDAELAERDDYIFALKVRIDEIDAVLPLKADLVDGKVPRSQLPDFVDDVLEFPTFADFPAVGESGILYVALDTGKGYLWSGSGYVLFNSLTAAEIKSLYESNDNTNAYTDDEKSKLSGIEAGAEVNQDDEEIKTQYENNPNTNAFTDDEKSKLAGIAAGADMKKSEYATKGITSIVDTSTVSRTALVINLVHVSGGNFNATLTGFTWETDRDVIFKFPEINTDLLSEVNIGINNVYKALKYSDTLNRVKVKHISKAKVIATYDGTELLMQGEPLIYDTQEYNSRIDSTFNVLAPINGSGMDIVAYGGTLYNAVVNGEDIVNTGSVTFGSVNGITYYDTLNSVFITGDGTTKTITNNSGATADIMALVVTNTIYENYTAQDFIDMDLSYFENKLDVEDFEVQSVGVNLFDEDNDIFEDLYLASSDGRVTFESGNTYVIIKATSGKQYSFGADGSDRNRWGFFSEYPELLDLPLSFGTGNTTGIAPSGTKYLFWYIANTGTPTPTNIILNEGTTAKPYVPYNSQTQKLITTLPSAGLVRSKAYYNNGKWYNDNAVLIDETVLSNLTNFAIVTGFGTDFFRSVNIPLENMDLSETLRNQDLYINGIKYTSYPNSNLGAMPDKHFVIDGANNLYVRNSDYDNDLSGFQNYWTTSTIIFHYETASPTPTEIDSDGTLICEEITTIIQKQALTTQVDVTYPLNQSKQVSNNAERSRYNQYEIEKLEDLVNPTPLTMPTLAVVKTIFKGGAVTITTASGETSLLIPQQGIKTIPARSFIPNQCFRVSICGYLNSTSNSNNTVKITATDGTTYNFVNETSLVPSTAGENVFVKFEFEFKIESVTDNVALISLNGNDIIHTGQGISNISGRSFINTGINIDNTESVELDITYTIGSNGTFTVTGSKIEIE